MNEVVNENVSLFYANDEYNNIILINEINEKNKENNFTCPICGGIVKPRAIDSNKISSHYYHLNAKDCSSESVMHYWYKNEFIKSGDKITLKVEDEYYNFNCKEVVIEQSHNTSFGVYRPDATIYTDKGIIFVEYKYSNKKNTEKYIDMWEELNCPIVEIDIKSLMQHKRTDYCFKTIFFDGQIYCQTRNNRINVINKYVKNNNINDRMRIKYLNGLLRDIQRYNLGQIDIEELVMIIDELNEFDLKALPKLLKVLKCNMVLKDYSLYKEKNIKKAFIEECKANKLDINNYVWMINFCYTKKYSNFNNVVFKNTCKIYLYNYDSYDFRDCKNKHNLQEYGYNIFGRTNYNEIIEVIRKSINNEKQLNERLKRKKIKKHIEKQKCDVLKYFKEYFFNQYGYKLEGDYCLDYKDYDLKDYHEVLNKYSGTDRLKKYSEYVLEEIIKIQKIIDAEEKLKNDNKILNTYISRLTKIECEKMGIETCEREQGLGVEVLISEKSYYHVITPDTIRKKLEHTTKRKEKILDKIKETIEEYIKREVYNKINETNVLFKQNYGVIEIT